MGTYVPQNLSVHHDQTKIESQFNFGEFLFLRPTPYNVVINSQFLMLNTQYPAISGKIKMVQCSVYHMNLQ